jgi:hypothetical protein
MGDQPVFGITKADLMVPVGRMLGTSFRDITEWRVEDVGYRHVNPMTAGLVRISGNATCADGGRSWSIIRKICRMPTEDEAAAVPADFLQRLAMAHRWDREALAYESGLLVNLGGNLVAPRCHGVEWNEPMACMWLEYVGSDSTAWPVDRYQLAARHLGQFNGQFLVGRPIPSEAWLSRRWLQNWIGAVESERLDVLDVDAIWEHPLVRATFAPGSRDQLRQVRAEWPGNLDLLDHLPQTLSHLDAFRQNLISRGGPKGQVETVAVDWSFVGIAPAGADASQLATSSVFNGGGEQPGIEEVDAGSWDGYLEGLADAGWRGDRRLVRAGYLASDVVRWTFVGFGGLSSVVDESARERTEQVWQMALPDFVRMLGARTEHLLAQARELRALVMRLRLALP